MIFIETPSNPMMLVSDIRAIAELAHKNGALLAVDNTFLSPHFQKPLTLGADIVVHSATKYICGHNDIIAGVIAISDADAGYGKDLELYIKSEGPNLTPIDSWLLLRSIKTLGLRVERQEKNAMKIADWLKRQPTVTDVYYVGLPDHPGHGLRQHDLVQDRVAGARRARARPAQTHRLCREPRRRREPADLPDCPDAR